MVSENLKTGKEYFGNLKNWGILSLVVIGIVLMLSGSVNAYSYSPVANGICNCGDGITDTTIGGNATDACVDCTAALNDSTNCANQVNYVGTVAITNYAGTCINNPQNFNNKTFDCQGHTIDGDNSGTDNGIFLNRKSGNTIRNCIITDFYDGIYLYSSSNNILTNNTLSDNTYGIYLKDSSDNTIINNTANNTAYKDIASLFLNPFYPMNVNNSNAVCYLCYDSKIQEVKHPHHEMKESIDIYSNTFQYTVDLGGIPVAAITEDGNLIDSNYGGKMLFMGSNDYFVNDLDNTYIVLVKGEELQISSAAGYTEPKLKELEGYRFKLLNITQSNGKPVGVVIEIEKPDGTTVQATASKQAGASLGTDANGHKVQIQAYQVMGNEASIIVYDMSTQYRLENNKKQDGWRVEIDRDYCNKVGIDDYGNSTDPIGNAYQKYCLTKLTLTHDNRYGIYLDSSSNNTITNNTANNSEEGIYLDYSSNNNLTNNTAKNNNRDGISLSSSSNNTLTNNTVNNNSIGIYSQNSNSTINNNYVCGNAQSDFNSPNWLSSYGDNNTCNKPDGWKDASVSGGCKICNVDISITNLTFILAAKTQKPIAGYKFNLNVSINSTLNTSAELTLKIDGDLTENITTNLSEGLNYKIFTLVAKGGLHNVSARIYSQTCDNNLSNNEYNRTYNASTPIILVKRSLNNLTKTNQTVNISFSGTQKGIMPSPKDNLTLTGGNYSKSLKGLGAKDIGTGKVVITYNGTINVYSYGSGEISIYTPSAASSDRQSRNVTVRMKDDVGITTGGNCNALPQCTFIYDGHNTETIKLDFNNLVSGTHILEYEVNITTDIYNLNYTIQSLSKGNNSLYLQNDSLTQWTPAIQSMAQNLTQNCSSDFERVGKISRWVYENINYNINLTGQSYNASWVFSNKQGVCAHYTNLLISMCRSIGIPARGVYGDVYNSSNYLGGHAWAEVFMDGRWYTVDPTFNEIGFIDSGHVSEGYDLSTLESSFFSAEGYGISFNDYNIYYPDLHILNTNSTSDLNPLINITPKWRVINVSGSTVTYEITGIFNNSRGGPGYIVGPAYLWASNVTDPIQVFVGQDKANASWNFSYNFDNLTNDPYLTGLTISTDPTPLTSASFNTYTAATYEIYDTQIPTTIQSGITTILNVTIRNIGANSGTANVEFYVDDSLNTTNNNLNVPGISGINTTQFNLNTASLSQGNHTIKFVVKKGNVQQDIFTKTITIGQLTCNINDNSPCPDNQFCNTSYQCQDLNCSGTTPYAFNHTCVNCTDNSTCGAGFCNLSHACQPISCTANETCHSWQFCNGTICQNLNCSPNQTAFNHACMNCTPFDLDSNQDIDIFDVVRGLEHLSEGKNISMRDARQETNLKLTCLIYFL